MMAQNMFDEVIYSPDFQLDGAHLVEASAGTGKTYNIQNIYARLIMEKGLRVSEILVMTFTDAATKELRDRLRQILQDIQVRFCKTEEEKRKERDDRADSLIGCAKDKNAARMNVELALLEFDRSAISTIHGFCQRVLSRYAFDAGIDFVQQVENNKTAELNVLAEDWWRQRPADVPEDLKLSTLKSYIGKLSGKTGYEISGSVPKAKKDKVPAYLLKQAQTIVADYENARAERRTLNFDDLLRALKDALQESNPRSGHLIAQLRREFKAALIDEFQDTDPVQYTIFERVFLNDNPNPLFFVGDPKQAIYAFRGGDIYTYLEAKRNPDLQRFSLAVNFRSTRRMIEAVNGMFLDAEERYTFGHELISYEYPVRVPDPPQVMERLNTPPLRIMEFPVQKVPSANANMPQVLDLMVKEILNFLNLKKDQDGKAVPVYSPGDIAVLTNSNPWNRKIHQKLQEAHIPSVIRRSGNVFASPAAKELWIFLRAAADPADREAVRCAVSTAFRSDAVPAGQDWDDPEILAQHIERFRELNRLWRMRGLAALTAELEKHPYRRLLAGREDGERQLADISQLWELCFSAVKQLGPSPEKLLSWLGERISNAPIGTQSWGETADNDESDADEYARELESDEDAVRIMTIHTAKGLQFPVVLLPDCWNFAGGKNYKPFEFHSGNRLVFSADEADKAGAAAEGMQEKTRLLYVAMTRAVQQMVIFTPAADPKNPLQEDVIQKIRKKIQQEPLTGLLDNLQKRCPVNPPYEIVQAGECGVTGKYEPVIPETAWKNAFPPPRFSLRPSKGSFSSLFQTENSHADPDGLDRDNQTAEAMPELEESGTEHRIFRLPMGTELGSCWHDILEKVPFDADAERIRSLVGKELANSGFSQEEDMQQAVEEMTEKTLRQKMTSPSGEIFSLRDIPWENRLSEQSFDFSSVNARQDTGAVKAVLEKYWGSDPSKTAFLQKLSGADRLLPHGFMTGIADLIFRYHGFYYIIDWKSNAIGGKTANFSEYGVRNEMAKHRYFLQYLLYAAVLHFYLKQRMGKGYSWEKNFGGIRYFFLRGIAAGGAAPVFADRPPEVLLEELGSVLGLGGC